MKQNKHEIDTQSLEEVSKTQVKKQMNDLQKIGERLVTLNKDQLKKIELKDSLLDAVILAQKITAHGAQRRQKQFIGKIMRTLSEQEIQYILDYFDILDGKSKQQTQILHFIEEWREKLMVNDNALTEFIGEYPHTDVQTLHTLIRNARREKELEKPPKYFREIFAFIKQIILE